MFASLQDPLSLVGRILLASLYVPAGFGKVTNFGATVGYIASSGVPMPELAAAAAVAIELGLGMLLLIGWQTRWRRLASPFLPWSSVLFFITSGRFRPIKSCSSSNRSLKISPSSADC